ncbi:winged helix-turn-helix transcriptional regulator [Pseudoalteromonas sp. Scap03]|uniref:winged helix-turn-helix domain-containing protein n=1 Tax=unclassified Pseudoalteromonas TaxID=194690 RepID=UPI0015C0740A|nr:MULTISPECIES: winged helix-turn-helix domain-containing protein [unclassified Pseudoalteromonas]NWL16703.1 winged helix-turn-helix transcriptional regulator [Pseudoalteromonas sp. Scap03]QLE81809.1 winged helix-turn-helix transcriptional regulator [Pseudoalteromonas sp. Scap25]QLE89753.1 winged helix-turn-helix transcriptional regulator [Pseudoalteromonas sp. Scap06]
MTESKTIKFDEIKYVVTKDNQSVTLNPLSFKLLFTLAQTPELVVSNKTLMTSVWPNTVISPDTLKQRVFVLRKSLEQSTIKGLSIQTVRGEGYRLLIEREVMPIDQTFVPEPTPNVHTDKIPRLNKKVFGITFVALLMTIIILIYVTQSTNNDKATSNNRIALWSNTPLNEMPENALSIYQTWNDLLSQANEEQRLQLILSKQRKELVLPLQARKDRLALISYFEVIEVNNNTTIKLSIVEPTTATILRTSSFSMSSTSSLLQALQSQLNGIESLMSSGKLYLNKQQREYAKDPIWSVLKALANPA